MKRNALVLALLIGIIVLIVVASILVIALLGTEESKTAVDGGFTEWSSWIPCPVTCGESVSHRRRSCSNPVPKHDGKNCDGQFIESQRCSTVPCPAAGNWGKWSAWGICSGSCDGASETRTRLCNDPAPDNGGADCAPPGTESRTCTITEGCPGKINGNWGLWDHWATCSAACGGGTQGRSRACDNPSPKNGGAECTPPGAASQDCNMDPCPIHGNWGMWTDWGACSAPCGGGSQCRSRACDNPAPQHNGEGCAPPGLEDQPCNTQACPVNGNWGIWNNWETCSVPCGGGTQSRSRSCNSPSPQYGGSDCTPPASEDQVCNAHPCPINGNWGLWDNWGTCSANCGGGTQSRSRACDTPVPEHGGSDCAPPGSENQDCNTDPCPAVGDSSTIPRGERHPSQNTACHLVALTRTTTAAAKAVNGNWGLWDNWGTCGAPCGGGSRSRSRACDSPTPEHGGSDCLPPDSETQDCNTDPCPINGNWGLWGNWGTCSATCGGGTQSRSRACDTPAPQHNGEDCTPPGSEDQDCNTEPCPVNGNWGNWGNWGACSVTCGTGTQGRTRACDTPAPQHGGEDCTPPGTDSKDCIAASCPVNGNWGAWDNWSSCSVTCGGGTQSRDRACDTPSPEHGGADCAPPGTDSRNCNPDPCPINGLWGLWNNWGTCSVTCGGGSQSRSRACDTPSPQHGGSDCVGSGSDSQHCNPDPCPIHGNWGNWGNWGACSVTCGGGSQSRSRACDTPSPQHGGADCVPPGTDDRGCNPDACPVNGNWGNWGNWGACSVTCGGGSQGRSRACDTPTPQHGGADCAPPGTDAQSCSTNACPVWLAWGAWSSCSVTCDSGIMTRERACSQPGLCIPSNGNTESTTCTKRMVCVCNPSSTCPVLQSWFPSGIKAFAFGMNNKNEGYYPSGSIMQASAYNFYPSPWQPSYSTEHSFIINGYCAGRPWYHYEFYFPQATLTSFTMITWIRTYAPDAFYGGQWVIVANVLGSWSNGAVFGLGSGTESRTAFLVLYFNNVAEITISTQELLIDLEWTQVGVTYESSSGQIKFYQNGLLKETQTASSGFSAPVDRMWPAMTSPSGMSANWASAELYNRALSEAEVKATFDRIDQNIGCP